jgi:Ca-activated chloride channel family protein
MCFSAVMQIETYLDYETVVANQHQPLHFAMRLTADETDAQRERPLAFCAVIDRSGSMAGQPLAEARNALKVAVKNLRATDLFALVCFDDQARMLHPLQPVTDKAGMIQLIDQIEPGGSTNLTAGWMLGRDALKASDPGVTRRLLLLSDGGLNQGITEPSQVSQIVAGGLELDRVRTSCLGFGDDYNEDLLIELARCTNGQQYDVASAEQLPAIFETELDGLQKISAQNVRLRIKPLDFCEKLAALGDLPSVSLPDGRVEYMVGDLVSGEEQILCFAMEALPMPCIDGEPVATFEGEELLELELLYDEITSSEVAPKSFTQVIRIQATQDPSEVVANGDVISWVALQRTGQTLNDATRFMDRGDADGAIQMIQESIRCLEALGGPEAVAEAVEPLRRLEEQISQGAFGARARKMASYRARSYKRMKSREMWSLDEAAPSFKESLKPKEEKKGPGDKE